MSRDLVNLAPAFEDLFEARTFGTLDGEGELDQGHVEADTPRPVLTGDPASPEFQFALGVWSANQILAALYAPVRDRK